MVLRKMWTARKAKKWRRFVHRLGSFPTLHPQMGEEEMCTTKPTYSKCDKKIGLLQIVSSTDVIYDSPLLKQYVLVDEKTLYCTGGMNAFK